MPAHSAGFSEEALTDKLLGFTLLEQVPPEQLRWLAAQGNVRKLQPEEVLLNSDDPIDALIILLEGKLQFTLEQQGEYRVINELVEGDITGALPYSRATTAKARVAARGTTTVLLLAKTLFDEMIRKYQELTEALVHIMTSRVRDFTREQQQTEKMAALGRLSAGLHHELNNPAAAALQASTSLMQLLHSSPEKFIAVLQLQLSSEQLAELNRLLQAREKKQHHKLSMLERSEREEQLATWLQQHQLGEHAYAMAEVLLQSGFSVSALQQLSEMSGTAKVAPVVDWLYSVVATENLAMEIQESSRRISTLVGAVKSYSHMDQSPERERADLEENIRNTLTMLNFKLRKKNVKVQVTSTEELPHPCVFKGQLNQVWTNLIDNAVDAMDAGGELLIQLQTVETGDIEVSITDNGSGISEEALGRIFDPFFSTKAMDKGTGMGLDISKKIVEQHGGSITVSSQPGKTTFTIILPENPTT